MTIKPQETIYAYDFDGVICDSSVETSMTGWKAARSLWQDMPSPLPPEPLVTAFREVRPLLETGYEAILIMRLLHLGTSVGNLCSNYVELITELVTSESLETSELKQLFGQTRDTWIDENETEWLAMNPLFTGVAQQLRKLAETTAKTDKEWYIITTKQERFVKRILKANQVVVNDEQLFGMDKQMSKQTTLLLLQDKHPENTLVFIEDRLETLMDILKNSQLQKIKLQLVSWGFNTQAERDSAKQSDIEVIHQW